MSGHSLSAFALRRELSHRGQALARLKPHDLSYGGIPSVVFSPEDEDHGNFITPSYLAILDNPRWAIRMRKRYTGGQWIPLRWERSRSELDCATSSDALLMNIFCYPGVLDLHGLCALMGIDRGLHPDFGFKPLIPLVNSRKDRTEVDMSLGSLLVEAKLTEGNFQTASIEKVLKYAGIEQVFDLDELPRKEAVFHSYQLIRGVLAAHHLGRSFIVLSDSRRQDMIEHWYRVMGAVRYCDLRNRLGFLSWQELAATLPSPLQQFLANKYGITSRPCHLFEP